MAEIFEIHLPSGETLKGNYWPADNAKANFTMITGMQEYAMRYDAMAQYFNKQGINVWILDAFGQGLNAPTEADLQKWPEGGFEKNVDAIHLMNQEAKKNGLPTVQCGHSMGSFMTQSRLERYPHSSDKTILIGSNGGQAGLMSVANMLASILVNKSNWDKPNPFLTNLGVGSYGKGIKDAKTPLDWLSYNEENVQKYIADPYLGHMPTGGFWKGFLNGMSKIWKKASLQAIAKDEVIYITAGEEDPVGQNGKGPRWLEKTYKELGIQNVTLKMYPHMRHEIHNEDDRETVYQDLVKFILG
ncbi:MAG: alpha/beta hydrolase [Bacilli bacterium]|nr:alpha/beta hydrolase [Bacilli bacterium]MBO6285945.1 alpha/beta hydrolase [Bacilli bacterium]